ncbi:hypothetical protein HBH95_180730 [Parastagonospora nodorum]|nr:hypothetical protein HBH95_180730 [Parastagonospora nodorum]
MLAKVPQRRSSSVVSNRSIALITNKFSVALLTKPAILNNANIALVDAVHYSVIDTLIITLIKDNNDLLGTVNSYIKPPLKRRKTKAADSRYAKLGKKAQLKKTRDEEELAKAKKEKEEKELTDAYILYFKELLSNNSRIFANAIGIGKTRAIVLAVLIGYFCFFSNSPLENIGRLTKEKAIEMQINTTNAISKVLAAANKLIILEVNTSAVHSKATKHYSALLAAQFIIVCSFRKVDKHVDILEKEGLNKLEASRRVIFNCFKMQAIASYLTLATLKAAYVKDLFTNLSKDYFLVREARAITKSSLKFQNLLNLCSELGLREKFSNESVLVMQRGITQDLDRPWIIVALIAFTEAIILTEATHVLAEIYISIVYFNLDSELELKVLGKQDVKTTSQDKL